MTAVIRLLFSLSSPRPWPALKISLLALSFLRLDASHSMGRIFDGFHAIFEPLKFLLFRHIRVGKVYYPSIIRNLIVSVDFVDRTQVINTIIVELLWLGKLLFTAFGVMVDWFYFIVVGNCQGVETLFTSVFFKKNLRFVWLLRLEKILEWFSLDFLELLRILWFVSLRCHAVGDDDLMRSDFHKIVYVLTPFKLFDD